MPMAKIEDISQGRESTKVMKEQKYQLPSQREYYGQRRQGDRSIALLIIVFLTCVYLLFAFVYLLEYRGHLKTELSKGFGHLVRSDTFWSFQRDAILLAIGYFLMIFVLKRLLFNKSDDE